MRQKTTINDVARLAGVSKRTVSRVINKSPMVGEKSRAKVTRIIAELGYQPNPQARGLAASRSYLIGMIYDNPDPYFIESVIRGISSVCLEHGYELVVHPCEYTDGELPQNVINFTSRTKIDGVIIPPPLSENDALSTALDEAMVPYVRLTAASMDLPHRSVVYDERAGAKEMTDYLLSCGHRRIAYISGPEGRKSTEQRRHGFLDTMKQHGVEIDAEIILAGDYSFESGLRAGADLLEHRKPPTAIFASNDLMAIGVINAIREKGLSVPHDISVAGFDDTEVASQIIPGLTSIRRPVRSMATQAALKLIAYIDGRKEEAALKCVLEPELVPRDSIASIR